MVSEGHCVHVKRTTGGDHVSYPILLSHIISWEQLRDDQNY